MVCIRNRTAGWRFAEVLETESQRQTSRAVHFPLWAQLEACRAAKGCKSLVELWTILVKLVVNQMATQQSPSRNPVTDRGERQVEYPQCFAMLQLFVSQFHMSFPQRCRSAPFSSQLGLEEPSCGISRLATTWSSELTKAWQKIVFEWGLSTCQSLFVSTAGWHVYSAWSSGAFGCVETTTSYHWIMVEMILKGFPAYDFSISVSQCVETRNPTTKKAFGNLSYPALWSFHHIPLSHSITITPIMMAPKTNRSKVFSPGLRLGCIQLICHPSPSSPGAALPLGNPMLGIWPRLLRRLSAGPWWNEHRCGKSMNIHHL